MIHRTYIITFILALIVTLSGCGGEKEGIFSKEELSWLVYDEDDIKHLTRRSYPALLKQLFPNIATRFNINSVKYQIKEKLG